MSSRFVALPVTQGDSFYLERDDKIIVFDGGRYPQNTPLLFKQYSKKNEIDYLICSHNDADHALGIIGILNSGIAVKEVWLPGKWREVLSQIIHNHNWVYHIWKESEKQEASSFSELDVKYEKETHEDHSDNELNNIQSEDGFDVELEDLCESDDEIIYGHSLISPFYYPVRGPHSLFMDAISAADRIIQVAKLAYAHGAKIRWFSFDEFSKTKIGAGGASILQPMNSVEILSYRKSRKNLFRLLFLTTANKESLVFKSEMKGEPTVLFTADSDLANVAAPVVSNTSELIVTAPHHGSESNKNVYGLFANTQPLWVRSDMKSKKRPCTEYKQQTEKYCTWCKSPNSTRKAIEFNSNNGLWTTNCHKCTCR